MSTEFVIPEVDLSAETLMAEAMTTTGLHDFGDESFREPLKVLVASLNEEADLNAGGRFGQYQRILNILINRLRVEAWIEKHPEILDEEINSPVVIIGASMRRFGMRCVIRRRSWIGILRVRMRA